MTGADGTTSIISYEYMNEDDVKPTTPAPPTPPTDRTTFLKDFFSGQQCLTGGSGWWKYELCYGKHVIQYHVRFRFLSIKKPKNFLLYRMTMINEHRLS